MQQLYCVYVCVYVLYIYICVIWVSVCVCLLNGKKAHPCQYGTSPECLVVNCWGLVFGKQPNKLTLPVGQSKPAKQHSLGGPKHGTDISGWWRRCIHTPPYTQNANYDTRDFPFTCQKHNIVSPVHDTHTHTLGLVWGEGRRVNLTGKGSSLV